MKSYTKNSGDPENHDLYDRKSNSEVWSFSLDLIITRLRDLNFLSHYTAYYRIVEALEFGTFNCQKIAHYLHNRNYNCRSENITDISQSTTVFH